ncbi:hypothetical protein DHEL01_v209784 [Diaporthe helianthi]|uniref:Rhodopsin domain-containing protein n=1 Tax=Diaporthe helianthi TaxID=158607 RepID=A0A2P5HNJ1_DIAHE|nr:hypothetical protein DHEL01_v209784 [Diaporthe helianthi]
MYRIISLMIAITYGLLMLLLKTAIVLEWIRIFVPHRTRNIFYWSSVILVLVNSGFYIASIAITFGNCRPLEKLWHFWLPGTCLESRGRDIASGVMNLALDVFILALPQSIIWTLKMDARRKTGVAVAFSTGLLVIAAAISRPCPLLSLHNEAYFPNSYEFKPERWLTPEAGGRGSTSRGGAELRQQNTPTANRRAAARLPSIFHRGSSMLLAKLGSWVEGAKANLRVEGVSASFNCMTVLSLTTTAQTWCSNRAATF